MKTKKEIEEALQLHSGVGRHALTWVLEPPTGYVEVESDDVRKGDFVSCNGQLTEVMDVDIGRIIKYKQGSWLSLSTLQDLGATFLRPTPEPEPEYVQLPAGTEPAEGMFVRMGDGSYAEMLCDSGGVIAWSKDHRANLKEREITAFGIPLYRLTVPKAPVKAVQFEGVVEGHGLGWVALVYLPVDDFPPGTRVVVTKVEGGQ